MRAQLLSLFLILSPSIQCFASAQVLEITNCILF